jgi:RHS repeat-associated protein
MRSLHFLFAFFVPIATLVAQEENPGWQSSPQPSPQAGLSWASGAAQTAARSGDAPGTERSAPAAGVTPLAEAISLGQAVPAEPPDGAQVAMLTAGGNEADEVTPAIAELARGLRNDPLKIFQYVYNYIDFEPYFGSKKGAHLTLLEGSGNEFDQCALLVALLRAADLNPTYKYGPCAFTYSELVSWMGLSATPFDHWSDTQFASYYGITDTSAGNIVNMRQWLAVYELLTPRGYFYVEPFQFGGVNYFSMPHVWVEVSVGGTVRTLSPSFKFYNSTAGLDLTTATGYSRGQILSDAGGTTGTPDWVQNLSYSALSSRLSTYTQNFLTYIQNNAHESSVDAIAGNRKVIPVVLDSFEDVYPVLQDPTAAAAWLPFQSWNAIPDVHMSKVRLRAGVYNYTDKTWTTTRFDRTITMPALRGRKISLTFSGNTARIYLDETLLDSSFNVGGSAVDLQIQATHNHYELARYLNGLYEVAHAGKSNQSETKSYLKNDAYAYAVIYCFSNADKLRRAREEVLDGYRRAGLTESDWRVKTELLNIMGLTWLYQTWQQERMIGPQFNVLSFSHHRFGRVAQEQSYYIDVGLQLSDNTSRSQNFARSAQFNFLTSLFGSAMEHGVIEQLQGEGRSAASTVKMIQLANQAGIRVYRATSNNWSTIKPLLNNYSDEVKAEIQTSINRNGGRALLPRNGLITLDSWRGLGYAIEEPDSVAMKISGDYFGGYNSQVGTVALPPLVRQVVADPGYMLTSTTNLRPSYIAFTTPQQASFDPIDMASGAYFLDKTELEIGGQAAPRGLTFSRHYNSNRRYDKSGGLGYGWTHNYDIKITKRSSVKAGLGETISYHAAPFFVGLLVASDLYTNHTRAKEWATAALVTQWATDQLKYNAVSVTMGNKTIEFIKMPNGTYQAPAGMNLTLAAVGENFHLTERHGATMVFDSSGKLTTITDLYNRVQHFTYSGSSLVLVRDGWGRTLTFTWAGGRIASVADGSGRAVSFGYTGDDLTLCTDVEGKAWRYQYDADHRMTTLRDPSNRIIVENIYDAKSRVAQQRNMGDPAKTWNYYYSGYCTIEEDPLGARTCYYYDSRARSLGVGDALNLTDSIGYDGHDRRTFYTTRKNETTYFYHDKNNNPYLIIDPAGKSTAFTYDGQLRLQTLTDKRFNPTNYTYNTRHQILTVTNPLGHTVTNTYDSNGNLQTVTDAGNKTTTYAYDAYGQLNKVTYADGKFRAFSNNARGDVLSETDPKNQTTSYTYNKRRQLLTATAPGSAAATRTYNNEGQLASETDARGNTTSYTYSVSGKVATTTFAALPAGNNVVTNTYDSRDWLSSSINSLGETISYGYDAVGNRITATDPLARTTTQAFDANRQMTSVRDPLLRTVRTAYNSRGEVTSDTDAASRMTTFGYDNNGNRTSLRNRRSQTYTFTFDNANRLTETKTPLQLTTGQAYTANDLLQTLTEPSGQATTFSYDDRLRLTSKADPTGTIRYGYDDNGNVLTVAQGTATITRTYDARNRVSSATDAAGNVIGYQWDDAGNLTRLTYPGNKQVDYTYNSRNQLATVMDWNGRVTTYSYDRAGRMTGVTRHNGTSASYEYDAAGQLKTVKEGSNGKLFRLHQFNYDAAGQLTSEFIAPRPKAYTLPPRTATYDSDNRLATWNGQGVAVDLDGNMTSGPLLSDTRVAYTYNSRNQLLSAGGVSYVYDAEGHRIATTQGGQTTSYVVDTSTGLSRVLIKEAPDGAKTFYVWGAGLLYEVSEAETTKVHHYDYRGSTIARTNDAGAVIGRIEYAPYGTITRRFGDTDTPFLYNGRYGVQTDSNGLIHMRARYYNPYLQRFLNPDPIGFSGGQNWYAFADGNPISLSDPYGLAPIFDASTAGRQPSGFLDFLDLMFTDFPAAVYSGVTGIPAQVAERGTEVRREAQGAFGSVQDPISGSVVSSQWVIGAGFELLGGFGSVIKTPENLISAGEYHASRSGMLGPVEQQKAIIEDAIFDQALTFGYENPEGAYSMIVGGRELQYAGAIAGGQVRAAAISSGLAATLGGKPQTYTPVGFAVGVANIYGMTRGTISNFVDSAFTQLGK